MPSWSSVPTPTLLEDPLSLLKAEPAYDNLGPRTTADGSSVLSLNKSINEPSQVSLEQNRQLKYKVGSSLSTVNSFQTNTGRPPTGNPRRFVNYAYQKTNGNYEYIL